MRRSLVVVLGAWLVLATPAGAAPAASTLRLASITVAGAKSNHASLAPSVSADGNLVAFESLGTNLDPSDMDRVMDIYRKNLGDHTLTLVSKTAVGVKGNLDSYPAVSNYSVRDCEFRQSAEIHA